MKLLRPVRGTTKVELGTGGIPGMTLLSRVTYDTANSRVNIFSADATREKTTAFSLHRGKDYFLYRSSDMAIDDTGISFTTVTLAGDRDACCEYVEGKTFDVWKAHHEGAWWYKGLGRVVVRLGRYSVEVWVENICGPANRYDTGLYSIHAEILNV